MGVDLGCLCLVLGNKRTYELSMQISNSREAFWEWWNKEGRIEVENGMRRIKEVKSDG